MWPASRSAAEERRKGAEAVAITLTELAARVGRELCGVQRVWIDDVLGEPFRAALPRLTTTVDTPSDAEVAVVAAEQISSEGELTTVGTGKVEASRVLAVVERLDSVAAAGTGRIVLRLARSPAARAARLFTNLGVVDVTGEGLLIVELAPGVAATDLQRVAEPTLMIAPAVTEMNVARRTDDPDCGLDRGRGAS
jgi:hypothetical protein